MENALIALEDILVPLGVCVALPVLVVWLIARVLIKTRNANTELIREAIRSNPNVDVAALMKALSKPEKTALQKATLYLKRGVLGLCAGIMTFTVSSPWIYDLDDDMDEWCFFGLVIAVILTGFGAGYFAAWAYLRKHIHDDGKTSPVEEEILVAEPEPIEAEVNEADEHCKE